MTNKSNLRKSWQEKLNDVKDLPKVVRITEKMSNKWAKVGDALVIPAPKEVDDIMQKVPKGRLITINEIRLFLAKKHKATIACPLTTGIFSWIAAHAAEEAKAQGIKNITPYWRTLKTGGIINEKYPGGVVAQKRLLTREGHKVIQKGSKYIVGDFERCLARL